MNSIKIPKPLEGRLSCAFQEDTLYILASRENQFTLYEATTQLLATTYTGNNTYPREGSIGFSIIKDRDDKIFLRDNDYQLFALLPPPLPLYFEKRPTEWFTQDGLISNNDNNLIATAHHLIPVFPKVFMEPFKQLTRHEAILYNHRSQSVKVFNLENTVLGCAVGTHVAAAFTNNNIYFFDLEL